MNIKALPTKYLIFLVIILSIFSLFFYLRQTHSYLRFSDGAKFADIARNIVEGNGYTKAFNFFNQNVLIHSRDTLFNAHPIPPLFPYSIAISFMLFGISDFSVIATSSLYFVLSSVCIFLLANKLFNKHVGILSALAFIFNVNFLDYATSGASETLLIFLILLTGLLSVYAGKFTLFSFGTMFLMYLARPQAAIYIAGFVAFLLFKSFGIKKGILSLLAFSIGVILMDYLLIIPIFSRFGVPPIVARGMQAIFETSFNASPSDILRGGSMTTEFSTLLKKLFYNLYNFYRSIDKIMSPYIFIFFLISLFIKEKLKTIYYFKVSSLLIFMATFIFVAFTIPFYRYIHPVVPLVYIFGIAAIFKTAEYLFKKEVIPLYFLIFLLVVGQTLGTFFIDIRFMKDRYNFSAAPSYVVLSNELKELTTENDVIVTNLDTWATWYGERKSIWLPHSPKDLILQQNNIQVDAIYLTNYLMEDENYRLGDEWRALLDNPESLDDSPIGEYFSDYKLIEVSENETYERNDYKAVLFIRKK